MTDHPSDGLQILKDCGALAVACPFLMSEPVFTTFLHEQDLCKGDMETRVAFLYGNCTDLIEIEKDIFRLKFSNKEIKRIMFLFKMLDKFGAFKEATYIKDHKLRGAAAKTAYIDFMAMLKNQSPDTWEYSLEQFILMTDPIGIDSKEKLDDYSNVVVYSRKEMKINGDDLLLIGIKPGPQIKTILDSCYAEILREPDHNTEGFLLALASGSWKIEKVSSIN
jgi:tRNA nucleotidyltransferase/poly(A) polymerase